MVQRCPSAHLLIGNSIAAWREPVRWDESVAVRIVVRSGDVVGVRGRYCSEGVSDDFLRGYEQPDDNALNTCTKNNVLCRNCLICCIFLIVVRVVIEILVALMHDAWQTR